MILAMLPIALAECNHRITVQIALQQQQYAPLWAQQNSFHSRKHTQSAGVTRTIQVFLHSTTRLMSLMRQHAADIVNSRTTTDGIVVRRLCCSRAHKPAQWACMLKQTCVTMAPGALHSKEDSHCRHTAPKPPNPLHTLHTKHRPPAAHTRTYSAHKKTTKHQAAVNTPSCKQQGTQSACSVLSGGCNSESVQQPAQ